MMYFGWDRPFLRKRNNMKTIILCGGIGYRLKEEKEFKPKPMVNIGKMPILWHIMKIYSHYGFNKFIIAFMQLFL